jgi:hypothetical protein
MKKCNNKDCESPLQDESNFSIDKSKKDGLSTFCKDCKNQYAKQYRSKNKELIKNKIHDNLSIYRIRKKEYDKEYNLNNKEKISERRRKYEQKRYNDDIEYKLKKNLRKRINRAIKNNHKAFSSDILVGCSLDYLLLHLSAKFYANPKTGEEMSFKNYGYYGWHIDHIRPCSSFDLSKEEEQKKCFNYKNLQPMWGFENILKGDQIYGTV